MKTEYIIIGVAVIAVFYLYNRQQAQVAGSPTFPQNPGAPVTATLQQAGLNAVNNLGGQLINNLTNALQPNSSGIGGMTETNYSASS